MLSAAILVGGRARRLDGIAKPLLTVGDRSILTRQLAALRFAGIERIVLVGRWRAEVAVCGSSVADAIEGGSLGALYTALLVATTDPVIVVAGDMPFITAALVRRLTVVPPECDAVVPQDANGWHPLCACYRRSIAMRLKARIDRGELSVRDALGDLTVGVVDAAELARIDPDGMMLMNVNASADYERAQRAAQTHA